MIALACGDDLGAGARPRGQDGFIWLTSKKPRERGLGRHPDRGVRVTAKWLQPAARLLLEAGVADSPVGDGAGGGSHAGRDVIQRRRQMPSGSRVADFAEGAHGAARTSSTGGRRRLCAARNFGSCAARPLPRWLPAVGEGKFPSPGPRRQDRLASRTGDGPAGPGLRSPHVMARPPARDRVCGAISRLR